MGRKKVINMFVSRFLAVGTCGHVTECGNGRVANVIAVGIDEVHSRRFVRVAFENLVAVSRKVRGFVNMRLSRRRSRRTHFSPLRLHQCLDFFALEFELHFQQRNLKQHSTT